MNFLQHLPETDDEAFRRVFIDAIKRCLSYRDHHWLYIRTDGLFVYTYLDPYTRPLSNEVKEVVVLFEWRGNNTVRINNLRNSSAIELQVIPD